jgi:uncharacterized protein YegL
MFVGKPEFVDNPEPRCPVVLLLDTSGSMQGEPIKALNKGIEIFNESVRRDSLSSLRVEVAIITFGETFQLVQDFVTISSVSSANTTSKWSDSYGRGYWLRD